MLRRPTELTETDFPIARRPFGEFSEVEPQLVLCARGKLYEVERWIDEGRPIQFPPPEDRKQQRRPTALQIAVKQQFHSLAALLLANGYDPNGDYFECLSAAVWARDRDMVELLLRFGADPHAVDFCSVLQTCDRELMDRFVQAGVDPCRENAVARALDTRRRPILGFIKQYRERFPCLQHQVDIALHVLTAAEKLRGIALMLWLGADPHAETPSSAYEGDRANGIGDSAFECALWADNPAILTQFLKRPIPTQKVQALLSSMSHRARPDLVERLLSNGADPNFVNEGGYPVLHGFVTSMLWRYRRRSAEEDEREILALELMLKAGAKLPLDERQLKGLRRDLADGESKIVIRLLDLLHQYSALTPAQLHELTRTDAVRRVLNGISKPRRDLFSTYTPAPVVTPVAAPRGGYWKRNWWQR